ncbi:hypothetical protein O0881_00185 [Janthinobacterium sp. SUN100]|uniref:hypothetical protein n=1 Tax=Janthinobacterium sp. SUN100 TaxID=3004101 RepID=UPI0025B02A7A|nr:hypothetical protein [Janthinobacterium sp. SUN100]MDN2700407.1 hypothetical protein [Janthinobacterium sp. SUN100]
MLRLWPEKQTLFLLPEHSWCAVGKSLRTVQAGEGTRLQQLNSMAQQLLSECAIKRGVQPVLDVVIGGNGCRLLMLPWQTRLRKGDEQRRYAEVCFESEGVSADEWIVQASYRHFGMPGLALAVRRDVMAMLDELATTRSSRLRSVLPLGGLAYWRHQPSRHGNTILILDEGKCLTAMAYANGRLDFVEIQPVGAHRILALTQLVRRCQMAARVVVQLSFWTAESMELDETIFAAAWPEASLKKLPAGEWQ